MKLSELATSISSKNAGSFHLTLDVVFDSRATYERVLHSGALSREAVAARYGAPVEDVVSIVAFDPGNAIKVNMRRQRASGDPGETDVFGAQQYAPLLDIDVP